MKSKFIIGILVLGLLVIAGCGEESMVNSQMTCDDGRVVSIFEGCGEPSSPYNGYLTKMVIKQSSGFVDPRFAYSTTETYEFKDKGVYYSLQGTDAGKPISIDGFFRDKDNLYTSMIENAFIKGDLMNYKTPDCAVIDAGVNELTIFYDGKSYSYDLVKTACEQEIRQTPSQITPRKAFNDIGSLLKSVADIATDNVDGNI
ncbi:MAG TPA: hypothetical protein VJJ21_04395 [Candidatus Nanoarchaeia archaeon]|nr:hypothetical protein [Candidatus Nanoarchaeia archaeon]